MFFYYSWGYFLFRDFVGIVTFERLFYSVIYKLIITLLHL